MSKEDLLKVIENFPQQCEDGAKLGKDIKFFEKIHNIIITGMGGTGFAGDVLKSYLDLNIPIYVNHGYHMPRFTSRNSLVFVLSFSGITDETIHAYREAKRIGARVVAFTPKAKLLEIAEKLKTPIVKVPAVDMPRHATGYMFFPMLNILNNMRITSCQEEIDETIAGLKHLDLKETAQQLAETLYDKIPIIYTSDKLYAIAKKWKIVFNETTKIPAFYNVIPNLNHSEITGFTNMGDRFYAIIIRDEDDFRLVKKRMDLTKDILIEMGCSAKEIKLTGKNLLLRIFSSMYLGELTSYYLALRYGVDPEKIEIQEKIKKTFA